MEDTFQQHCSFTHCSQTQGCWSPGSGSSQFKIELGIPARWNAYFYNKRKPCSHNTCMVLTKFTTSRGGYLCMGINRLKEEGDVNISLPPGFSPAWQTRESLAREPAFLLFLFLPLFLPILPLHSPSTRWNTNRNGVSTLTASQTPDARLQNPSGVVSRNQRTYVLNSIRWSRVTMHRLLVRVHSLLGAGSTRVSNEVFFQKLYKTPHPTNSYENQVLCIKERPW